MVGNNYVVYFAGLANNSYEISNEYKETITIIKNSILEKIKSLGITNKNIVFIDPIKNIVVPGKKSYKISEIINLDTKSKAYADLILYVLDSSSSSSKILDMIATYETNDSKDIVLYSVFDSDEEKFMNHCLDLLDDSYLIYKDIDSLINHISYKLDNEEDDFSSFLKAINFNSDEGINSIPIDNSPKKIIKRKNTVNDERVMTTPRNTQTYANTNTTNNNGPAKTMIKITADPEEDKIRYIEESKRSYDPTLYKDNYVATSELPFQTARPKPVDYNYNRPAGTTVRSRNYTPSSNSGQSPSGGSGNNHKLPMATIPTNSNNNTDNSITNNDVNNGIPAQTKIEVKNKEGGAQIGIF